MLRSAFIFKSIWHFRKQHLAVIAGTAISTAILTGALIIGDSVRYSLEQMVDVRLGKTQYSIIGGSRFFRAELATDISKSLHADAAAILLLRGMAIQPETDERLNKVQLIGIDSCFYKFAQASLPVPASGEAILSENTAKKLNLKQGDHFLLRLEDAGPIPVNSPFSRPAESVSAMRLTVSRIAGDSSLANFSLKNNQTSAFNIFISREFLAEKLNLKSLANIILLGNIQNSDTFQTKIYSALKKNWMLSDAGLKINLIGETGLYELNSNRIFIDEAVSKTIESLKIDHQNILTYLANSIHSGTKQTPYSFVTASTTPLYSDSNGKDGIIINRWLADDLQAKKGDSIRLDYFIIGPFRKLNEQNKKFIVRDIIPTNSSELSKRLMPTFPGLSDAGSCRDWNAGIPIDLKRIRDKDEAYWNTYKGSPKAFISLETGKDIWKNPFGSLTSVRFDKSLISEDSLQSAIMSGLKPSDLGISIIPVLTEGEYAAGNSVDFGSLFLSLSFFVIAASVLLLILIYSLNTVSRKTEIALLAGLGFTTRQIIRFRFSESLLVILSGVIIGSLLGILYCKALLAGLNSVWQDAVRVNNLKIKILPLTMIYGTIVGILIASISIFLVSRASLKEQVASILKTISISVFTPHLKKSRTHAVIAFTGIISSLVVLAYSIFSGAYLDATLFLTSGGLFLIGSASAVSAISIRNKGAKHKAGMNILSLAIRNAGRFSGRSYAVILIMALGIFSIILTSAYHKTFYGEENLSQSGTGGYQLWAETSIPVPFDLNSGRGKEKLIVKNSSDLDSVHFIQFHSIDGDDASCLNLNQVRRPRILGIPPDLFDIKKSFSFVNKGKGISMDHPWKDLVPKPGANVFCAFADQTVIQYGLQKSVNDTLRFLNETGKPFNLRIAAGMDNSIFQGNLLISDSVLLEHFPSSPGSSVMLIDLPERKVHLVSSILKNSLKDFGIEITPASARLAEFNSVENTYLSVFLALGGLGLILGTFGLGILLYRNIFERKHELALLQALGFSKNKILQLIIFEYGFLLLSGMICGILSACIAIFPSLISPAFHVQLGFAGMLLLIIFLSGFLWIFVPSFNILKSSLIPSLKND